MRGLLCVNPFNSVLFSLLQQTLAFNPAAMLPGAARPPKKQDTTTETAVPNKVCMAIIFERGLLDMDVWHRSCIS